MSTFSTGAASNAPDTGAVKELLTMMSATLATLYVHSDFLHRCPIGRTNSYDIFSGKTFDTLTEQSTRVATLGPQLVGTIS